MRAKTTIPITEARRRIFDIAEDVQKPGVYYYLTEKGRPKAVIMSAEEFESWMETLDVMEEFPDLEKHIKQAEKEYKEGKYVTLDELLSDKSFALADKGKKKYGVSSHRSAKSTKRNK